MCIFAPTKAAVMLRINAGVVKLVDTPDLGSGASRCVGSSPIARTKPPDNGRFFYLWPEAEPDFIDKVHTIF